MTSLVDRIEALEGEFVEPEDAVSMIVITVHDTRRDARQRDAEREAIAVRANGVEVARAAGESFDALCHRAVSVLGLLRRRSVPVLAPVF